MQNLGRKEKKKDQVWKKAAGIAGTEVLTNYLI